MKHIYIIIFYTLMSGNAFAYLDPGSGGFIIQAIFGFLAAIFAYVTFFWNKMKTIFDKFFKKNNNEPEDKS